MVNYVVMKLLSSESYLPQLLISIKMKLRVFFLKFLFCSLVKLGIKYYIDIWGAIRRKDKICWRLQFGMVMKREDGFSLIQLIVSPELKNIDLKSK